MPYFGTPTDWTNGTGVFPSGGVISIPANSTRQWFLCQNRDVGEVTIAYQSNAANGSGSVTETVSLDPASASGNQGGSDERSSETYVPRGTITVTGTAGQQITVLEG